jgi:hypothetical protein
MPLLATRARTLRHLRNPARRFARLGAAVLVWLAADVASPARAADPPPELEGRVVAVGIPGAGAVRAIGAFHPGGPIYDKPAFRATTQAGAVLDPDRIFVASTSNFGAPVARADYPEGAILSIDPRGDSTLVVPPGFAAAGGQASAIEGRVFIYTAQSQAFINRAYNPGAVTADWPAVSNPTGISINNAFGRPWFTSLPLGPKGAGTQSVIDPDGRPLDGAPSKVAGGIFAGDLTNRAPQLTPGAMTSGALATALLGKSPDGGGRAVFAGLHNDGSVIQIHVEKGVDGLAPAGTITPFEPGPHLTRSGMAFNWVPNAILYVADPGANAIVAITLVTENGIFRVDTTRRMSAPDLDAPIDLAPAVAEIANPAFSSNTTLAGDADLYVVNRGNGTIARVKQDGTVLAVRRVTVPGVGALGADRLNGIAVSNNASRIWVTVSGSLPGQPEGAVIELPAFGAPGS